MSKNFYTVKIAGPAGLGIKSVGQIFSKSLIKHGFSVHDYSEYPSLVRGGHNTYQVTFSKDKIFSPHFNIDVFFSISPNHWQNHISEFSKDTLIFSDEEFSKSNKSKFLNLPLKKLTEEIGNTMSTNIICLGVVTFIFNLNNEILKETLTNDFGKNTEINLKAFDLGFKFAKENFSKLQKKLVFPKKKNKISNNFNDGNESFGWGFLKGGGNFYAAYPMTPSTGALHFLAPRQKEFNIKVIHPEDEIASANITAGAAFAGARAATGTSGGGFALMDETVSFCGVTEIGVVFYVVSRPGPATGLPTWTGQSDLLHIVNSGHGEFPLVVMAPGDHEESFEFSAKALNLAKQLQTPIFVVSDKMLGESSALTSDFAKIKVKIEDGKIVDKAEENFKRYSLKPKDGISPFTIPGVKNGEFLANSYEHDEFGFSTEDSEKTIKMADKRMKKMETAIKISPKPLFFGSDKAKKLIISWGSLKGPILEALESMKNKDDYMFLQIRTLWPINPDLRILIEKFKEIIVIENNQTSQVAQILKSQFNFNPTKTILKYDGRPFFPEEIVKKLSNK
jgi:2-oxoglutarate/2-oxoacid ferredoxin oxidoreductase subunit alpha